MTGSRALRVSSTPGPVIGSLCTGVAGLDLGVLAAFGGGRIAWCADPDPHVSEILAARLPGVPNLGDLRQVDFTKVEPVDIVTAGFPCQDISAAGRRAGIENGARSGLWTDIVAGIRVLRPSLVVVENVAALRWKDGGLHKVLADLAGVGYDAIWRSVRASDIGGAHRRERVFLLAFPRSCGCADDADSAGSRRRASRRGRSGPAARGRASGQPQQCRRCGGETPADADRGRRTLGSSPDRAGIRTSNSARLCDADRRGAAASDSTRIRHRDAGTQSRSWISSAAFAGGSSTRRGVEYVPCLELPRGEGNGGFLAVSPTGPGTLLPTPTAHDGTSNGISAPSRRGGPSLLDSLRLLPTPRATDGTKGCPRQRGSKGDLMLPAVAVAVTAVRQAR